MYVYVSGVDEGIMSCTVRREYEALDLSPLQTSGSKTTNWTKDRGEIYSSHHVPASAVHPFASGTREQHSSGGKVILLAVALVLLRKMQTTHELPPVPGWLLK
jgi:hypothetical protein